MDHHRGTSSAGFASTPSCTARRRAFIAEQFPTQVRYAGASLAYTFAGVFAGGIAPLAFTALYRAYGTPMVVALYTTVALLITAIVLRFARVRRE